MPAYGFERHADPPPLEINVLRLLSEFHAGSLTMAATWQEMLAPATVTEVLALAEEAGAVAGTVRERLGLGRPGSEAPSTAAMAEAAAAFMFPDDLWARVVYDLIAGARVAPDAVDTRVAALVPVYFGRVASLVIENRELSTDRAEAHVERQAREFERLKPYLVARWDETGGAPADPAP
ncbi:MAG: hypothetical protein A2V84_14035 [Chloroflexi bacterium RBG_16_70_13]|nr:MAG: hypothetical protein A2V84_14035 [Chloroflexi bacterium RBG_16_70_13]